MLMKDFMDQLKRSLFSLPPERMKEILEDIQNHFEEGLADGMTEEELSTMLGAPDALAREYIALYAVDRARKNPSPRNLMKVIWAGVGMGILNLMFILPVGLVLFALWISLTAAALSMTLGGIVLALASLVDYFHPLFFVYIDSHAIALLGGIAVCSLGMLLGIGLLTLGRKMGQGTVKYVQANLNMLTNRRKGNDEIID